VPDCDPMALKLALLKDFNIEIPCFKWKDHTIVRLSVQGYNSQAQMDQLIVALKKILPPA
jgi:isopenicillin-N epimerase